jgi:hypothetical protein
LHIYAWTDRSASALCCCCYSQFSAPSSGPQGTERRRRLVARRAGRLPKSARQETIQSRKESPRGADGKGGKRTRTERVQGIVTLDEPEAFSSVEGEGELLVVVRFRSGVSRQGGGRGDAVDAESRGKGAREKEQDGFEFVFGLILGKEMDHADLRQRS